MSETVLLSVSLGEPADTGVPLGLCMGVEQFVRGLPVSLSYSYYRYVVKFLTMYSTVSSVP